MTKGWRRLALSVLVLALALELGAHLALAVGEGAARVGRRAEVARTGGSRAADGSAAAALLTGRDAITVHPYTGTTLDPTEDPSLNDDAVRVLPAEATARRAPGRHVTALLGGSLAHQVGVTHGDALLAALRDAHPDHDVVLVVAAAPDWKQPQPLFALSWLLARGYEPDEILVLDGADGVHAAAAQHRELGTNPAFPIGYGRLLSASFAGPRVASATGKLAVLTRRRRDHAAWLGGSALRFSGVATLLWTRRDAELEAEQEATRRELRQIERTPSYAAHGPALAEAAEPIDDAGRAARAISVWVQASAMTRTLGESIGARVATCLSPTLDARTSNALTRQMRAAAERARLPLVDLSELPPEAREALVDALARAAAR